MKNLLIALSAIVFVTSCYRAPELPQVTTTNPVVSDTAVIVGGEVTFGGNNKTIRGVRWSKSRFPWSSDDFMLDASKGVGVYSFDILGQLEPNTQYYVAAYAENKYGSVPVYGDALKLTSNCCNPYNAIVNSRGCIECDNYAVGDTFVLNNMAFIVADKSRISSADYNADLSKFCVSKIKNMSYLLVGKNLLRSDLSGWDVSNVTDMNRMFAGVEDFNVDIGNWDVSNVTDMSYMFAHDYIHLGYHFNGNITNWDVSNVTDMEGMFLNASSFNQNLSNWCVSQIPTMPTDFSTNSALTTSNHPVWGTCP